MNPEKKQIHPSDRIVRVYSLSLTQHQHTHTQFNEHSEQHYKLETQLKMVYLIPIASNFIEI